MGKPATTGCRLAPFRLSGIDAEFLEPGPERSAWRDPAYAGGPGCQHIAFKTRNLQRGNGTHGRYIRFDTLPQLGRRWSYWSGTASGSLGLRICAANTSGLTASAALP